MKIELSISKIVKIISALEIKKRAYVGIWDKNVYENHLELEKFLKEKLKTKIKI